MSNTSQKWHEQCVINLFTFLYAFDMKRKESANYSQLSKCKVKITIHAQKERNTLMMQASSINECSKQSPILLLPRETKILWKLFLLQGSGHVFRNFKRFWLPVQIKQNQVIYTHRQTAHRLIVLEVKRSNHLL